MLLLLLLLPPPPQNLDNGSARLIVYIRHVDTGI